MEDQLWTAQKAAPKVLWQNKKPALRSELFRRSAGGPPNQVSPAQRMDLGREGKEVVGEWVELENSTHRCQTPFLGLIACIEQHGCAPEIELT